MPEMMKITPIDGLDLVTPSTEMDEKKCTRLQNYIARYKKVSKFGGTDRYNQTELDAEVSWVKRYYGIDTANNRQVRKTFAFSDGAVYVGDDTAGTFTEVQSGFTKDVLPEEMTMQVAERSVMFFMTGEDPIYYYDGNDANTWYKSAIEDSSGNAYKFVQGEEWLSRFWAFEKNSSILYYSKTLYPENFTDTDDSGTVTIGQGKDSYIVRVMVLGQYLFVFKNDGIYT